VIALTSSLGSGRVVTRLSIRTRRSDTIDDFGRRLYAVNARFGAPTPATTDYQVVQLRKPKGG
jgi:hypothetical protein